MTVVLLIVVIVATSAMLASELAEKPDAPGPRAPEEAEATVPARRGGWYEERLRKILYPQAPAGGSSEGVRSTTAAEERTPRTLHTDYPNIWIGDDCY